MEIHTAEFRDLQVGYPDVTLVQDMNIQLPLGTPVRIIGSTGSGKSAILRVAGGLLNPIKGDFYVNETAIHDLSFEELLPYRMKIGYGFDQGGLLNNRTLRENLALPLEYHKVMSSEDIDLCVNRELDRFDLLREADRRPFAVSGSQRKATCVARAMILDPELLILDEPATGLGEAAKNELVSLVKERMRKGQLKYVLYTSDDPIVCHGIGGRDLLIQLERVRWVEKIDMKESA
jgi:phospholipid/cholesterol/gamma-HCH transport system ATP-binding protein